MTSSGATELTGTHPARRRRPPGGTHRWTVFTGIALALVSCTSVKPVAHPRLFGISADSASHTRPIGPQSTIPAGRSLDVINVYQAWVWTGGLPTQELSEITALGAVPMITWEPWDPRLGTEQPDFTLTEITGGRYDGYLRRWATEAAGYAAPLYLRFAHEMNGDWYPWAVTTNGNDPNGYRTAYQHVREIFQSVGASNVKWVWSPHVLPAADLTALPAAFPGADQVDIIGVDGYLTMSNDGDFADAQTPDRVFGPTINAVAKIAPNLPVWITEVGCSAETAGKARCTNAVLTYLTTTRASAIIWFDLHPTTGPDWRLAPHPDITTAIQAQLTAW